MRLMCWRKIMMNDRIDAIDNVIGTDCDCRKYYFAVRGENNDFTPNHDGDFIILEQDPLIAIGPDRDVYIYEDKWQEVPVNDLPLTNFHDIFVIMGLIHLMERS